MNDKEKVEGNGEETLKRSRSKGSSRNKNKVDGGSTDRESKYGIHMWTERERRKKMKNMFSDLHALLPQLPAKAEKCTIVDEAIKYISTLQETLKSLEKKKEEKMKLQVRQGQDKQLSGHHQSTIGSTSHTPARHQEFPDQQQQLPLIVNNEIEGVLGLNNNTTIINNNNIVGASAFGVPAFPVSFQTWFSPCVVLNMCGDVALISICSLRKPGLLSTIFYILNKHNLDVLAAHLFGDQYRCIYSINARATGGNSSGYLPKILAAEDTFKLAAGEMNEWISSC